MTTDDKIRDKKATNQYQQWSSKNISVIIK